MRGSPSRFPQGRLSDVSGCCSAGAVELENLPLRKDALREFDLPFEVKAGETPHLPLRTPAPCTVPLHASQLLQNTPTSALCCCVPGFIGKITLQIPFYRPHSDPWVISMSQLNLIIGPAQLQEYDEDKEKEEERQRKQRLLRAFEDKFKATMKTALQ